jgi:hypothetical protein
MPSIEDSPQPFIRELSRRRTEHPKGSLQNEMFKQLGNSLYGKLGQGNQGDKFPLEAGDLQSLERTRRPLLLASGRDLAEDSLNQCESRTYRAKAGMDIEAWLRGLGLEHCVYH